MKLEITKEKVLEAASKCQTAKATLKTLFPEVFEDGSVSLRGVDFYTYEQGNNCKGLSLDGERLLHVSANNNGGSCIFLSQGYNWEIEHKSGADYLIPTKK
jgi:hypothetical protein